MDYGKDLRHFLWSLLDRCRLISVSFTAATGVRIPYGTPLYFNGLGHIFITGYDPYSQFTHYAVRDAVEQDGIRRAFRDTLLRKSSVRWVRRLSNHSGDSRTLRLIKTALDVVSKSS